VWPAGVRCAHFPSVITAIIDQKVRYSCLNRLTNVSCIPRHLAEPNRTLALSKLSLYSTPNKSTPLPIYVLYPKPFPYTVHMYSITFAYSRSSSDLALSHLSLSVI
jgi:hypothetical protein